MMLIKILDSNHPQFCVHLLMSGVAAHVLPGNHRTRMLFSG